MKTGKIQHDMFPPEMPKKGEAREYYEGGSGGSGAGTRGDAYDRRRENSMPVSPTQRPQYPQPFGGENGQRGYSQPQISVTPARHGYAELDSETPGRYRAYGDEKSGSGRGKSNSFSGRYTDEDYAIMSPPPAYRE